uniref:Uncharacterized protein n=1 Tax=Arundo donax TaxID=35708 RepID=A0A0A9AEN4_ARUDO
MKNATAATVKHWASLHLQYLVAAELSGCRTSPTCYSTRTFLSPLRRLCL